MHNGNGRNHAAARFVILNAPRTGSNYLCTLLDDHPEILCHHEIFNPHVVGVARHLAKQGYEMGTVEERNRDPLQFLERIWENPFDRRCVGFKLCWHQDDVILRAVLTDPRVRKIVLKRRNRVKSFVSLLLARATAEWVVYEDAPQPQARPRIRVDATELWEHIQYNRRYYGEIEDSLRATCHPRLELFYEDFLSGPGLRDVLSFLDIARDTASQLRGQCWKLTSHKLPEVISNFDELAEQLRGTELEPELYSPDY